MSTTYAGSTVELVAGVPATYDRAGYEGLTYEPGECALEQFPEIARDWTPVTETLVCKKTNSAIKGSAIWMPVNYNLSNIDGDPAQAIYEALENDSVGVGSFKFTMDGASIFYLTAQVSKFSLVNGGEQNAIYRRGVTLLIQSEDVIKVTP